MFTVPSVFHFVRTPLGGGDGLRPAPDGLLSFPLKSLVADSNNKLQSDFNQSQDQLEPLKSLRTGMMGKKSICNLHRAGEC